jgi:hypothetical protein
VTDLSAAELEQLAKQARMRELAADPDAGIPVRPAREYIEATLPIPAAVLTVPLVVRGEITVTVAKSGKGKTTMNLQRMMRWAGGSPMFPDLPDFMAPTEPLKVLVVENEGAAQMFQMKLREMFANAAFLSDEEREAALDNIYIWKDGGFSNFKIDADADFALLQRAVEKIHPDVLFVEPFRSLWKGNENDSTEMSNVVDRMLTVASDGHLAVILSHHERKSGVGESGDFMDVARGSSALDGAVAAFENFRSLWVGSHEYRELSYSKVRYWGAPDAPVRMEYVPEGWHYTYVAPDADDTAILTVFKQSDGAPLTVKDVQEALGDTSQAGYQRIKRRLDGLVEEERMRRIKPQSGGGIGYRLVSGEQETGGLEL